MPTRYRHRLQSTPAVYDRGLGYMPPVQDLNFEPLPNPPARAPRIDMPINAFNHVPRWRSPHTFLRNAYLPHSTHGRRANSARYRLVQDLAAYQPAHIVLTLDSSDILRFGNVPLTTTQSALRASMPPLWLDGVSRDIQKPTEWTMKFRGRPWTTSGEQGIAARRMLCRVFKCLANNGWSYVNAINTARRPMRHIFGRSQPDPDAQFLAISLSASQRTVSVIDCPQDVAQALTHQVRNLYTPQIIKDGWLSNNVFCLHIRRHDFFGHEEDIALFLAQILKATAERGYKLDASIPLARSSSLLRFGKQREVWIFRRLTPAVL